MAVKILLALLFCTAWAIDTTDGPSPTEFCCDWPLDANGVNSANPSFANWECKEPISFVCYNLSPRFKATGVVADVTYRRNENIAKNVVLENERMVEPKLICDPVARSWNIEGQIEQHKTFSCAYQLNDGTWLMP